MLAPRACALRPFVVQPGHARTQLGADLFDRVRGGLAAPAARPDGRRIRVGFGSDSHPFGPGEPLACLALVDSVDASDLDACAALGPRLAVRSSSTWEDGDTSAHAGATATVLMPCCFSSRPMSRIRRSICSSSSWLIGLDMAN